MSGIPRYAAQVGRSLYHLAVRGSQVVRASWRRASGREPHAERPKPWESSVLDDIADSRPWNLLLKATRRWALVRLARDRPGGVTVLVVNWETAEETATTLSAVRHFSPPGTEVLVVDNASRDGSAGRFRGLFPGIRVIRLPANVGHSIALDLGTHLARTELVVTLDSDAFPLDHGWLDPVTAPFRDPSVVLAGTPSKRGFVHPMYSCVRRRAFVERRLSWQQWVPSHEGDAAWGVDRFDAGELLSRRLDPHETVFLERTPNRVEGLPGMTVADVVYHHGAVTRERKAGTGSSGSWDVAVAALLPPAALPRGGQDGRSGPPATPAVPRVDGREA